MTRRSGLYLAEIRQPKLEEGISLDMEIKCTIMPLIWRKIHNDSSDPVKAFKLHIQRSK